MYKNKNIHNFTQWTGMTWPHAAFVTQNHVVSNNDDTSHNEQMQFVNHQQWIMWVHFFILYILTDVPDAKNLN